MPGLVKLCEALLPGFSTPVLKLPSRAVAVWLLGPWLVQVTASPTRTVVEPGVYWKSTMVTPGSTAAWAVRCASSFAT